MSLSVEQQHIFDYFKMVNVSFYEDSINVCRDILTSLEKTSDNEEKILKTLFSINDVIKNYNFEIVEGIDEESSRKVHCLVSTNTCDLVRKVNFYEKHTIELLFKVIDEYFTSENGYVSEISCLNSNEKFNTSKSNIQSSLERLCKDKWISSEKGKLKPGVRSVLELEMVIKNQYENVKYCALCKMLSIQGPFCPNCKNTVHLYCLKKFHDLLKKSSQSLYCPFCKKRFLETEMNTALQVNTENETNSLHAVNSEIQSNLESELISEIDIATEKSSEESATYSDPPVKKSRRNCKKIKKGSVIY